MFPNSIEQLTVSADGSLRGGWSEPTLVPTEQASVPGTAVGLHYGQIAFEGMRARRIDGVSSVFRPDLHWHRLCRSMERLSMPVLDQGTFIRSIRMLLEAIDTDGTDATEGAPELAEFIYLRPIALAVDKDWSMGGAQRYRLFVFAGPANDAFQGLDRVVARVEAVRRRAWPGGTGDIKVPANYGPAFATQRLARRMGAHTVLWLDPLDRSIEEFSSMNVLFLDTEEVLWAPPPGPTVLDGVTRRSVVELARVSGFTVRESPVRWPDPKSDEPLRGTLFAAGTASGMAVVHEVREEGPDGELHTWRSSPSTSLRELQVMVEACYGGATCPEWWVR